MGTIISVFKTLLIPAIISLVLFLLLTYLVVPLWRYYRNRYGQYLPLDSISTQTTSLRVRTQDAILRWISSLSRWRSRGRDRVDMADDESDAGFGSEEGEELNNIVGEDPRHALSLDTSHIHADSNRRLSRDLEEGFRDDSDDDDDGNRRNRR
ncbi:hypothetical protein EKO27_g10157 [Xylaria grammica]|uniref:Uncharacterized protein n=1 Tax=Xylaria grammica TaxID=363999 RepID=A0A439CRY8_9PEZI|nr:hypothetical protein EKO27_g10157 [Xylaria grammica]